MTFKAILAIASLAAIASTGARADEADASQYVIQFQGSRTRAEVKTEAALVPTTRSREPAGSRVAAPVKSAVEVKALRAATIEAMRQGQISQGEASHF
jgi:hypothetical protein